MNNNEQQHQDINHHNNKPYHQQNEHEDIHTMKLNQSLPPQANFLLFLLISISLLANTTRSYDYNIVVGCGVYFLSTKNPFLHKMVYFYLLVGLTILADALVIVLLYEKVDMFHSLIVPGIEIVLKILLLIVQGLYWRSENEEENIRMKRKNQKNAHLLKEIEERKSLQASKLIYQQSKLQQKPNPGNYYLPKYNNASINDRQTYKTQQFKEFDNQQFFTEQVKNQKPNKSRKN